MTNLPTKSPLTLRPKQYGNLLPIKCDDPPRDITSKLDGVITSHLIPTDTVLVPSVIDTVITTLLPAFQGHDVRIRVESGEGLGPRDQALISCACTPQHILILIDPYELQPKLLQGGYIRDDEGPIRAYEGGY